MTRFDSDVTLSGSVCGCWIACSGKQEREANNHMVVYLIDASPKMFTLAITKVRHEPYLYTKFVERNAFFKKRRYYLLFFAL
jgi:hypothetical protein